MLSAITILLFFQLIGEVITQAFQLPVPGPVIGMVLLFIALVLRGGPGKELRETSSQLLQYLSMLFIPAGAGVMLHFGTLREEWLPILLAATVGTTLVIAITALLLQALIRTRAGDGSDGMPGTSTTARAHPSPSASGPAPDRRPGMSAVTPAGSTPMPAAAPARTPAMSVTPGTTPSPTPDARQPASCAGQPLVDRPGDQPS